MNGERLKEIELELDVLLKRSKANDDQQNKLSKEAEDLTVLEQKLRSEMIQIQKILCSTPWEYGGESRLHGNFDNYPGLESLLGRLLDYHTSIALERNVDLVIADGDLYLDFAPPGSYYSKDQVKENMQDFIQRWGITLNTEDLQEKRECILRELEQVEQILANLGKLQGTL